MCGKWNTCDKQALRFNKMLKFLDKENKKLKHLTSDKLELVYEKTLVEYKGEKQKRYFLDAKTYDKMVERYVYKVFIQEKSKKFALELFTFSSNETLPIKIVLSTDIAKELKYAYKDCSIRCLCGFKKLVKKVKKTKVVKTAVPKLYKYAK